MSLIDAQYALMSHNPGAIDRADFLGITPAGEKAKGQVPLPGRVRLWPVPHSLYCTPCAAFPVSPRQPGFKDRNLDHRKTCIAGATAARLESVLDSAFHDVLMRFVRRSTLLIVQAGPRVTTSSGVTDASVPASNLCLPASPPCRAIQRHLACLRSHTSPCSARAPAG